LDGLVTLDALVDFRFWLERHLEEARHQVEMKQEGSRVDMGQCVASVPLTRRLTFADVMMNSGTSCTPITGSAKPHQPPLVAVASFKQAASPSA
jgi:hypothetical protein